MVCRGGRPDLADESLSRVHVPVLLWGGAERLESLLIGIDLSILTMMAEAAAWWGLDNFIVPIWGYMLLKSLLKMNAAELAALEVEIARELARREGTWYYVEAGLFQ